MNPQWSDLYAPLIGRILVGGYFLLNGITACLNLPGTVVTIASAGIPAPAFFGIIVICIEVFGGIMLVAGFKTRTVALALALFSVASAFWYMNESTQLNLFMQNMAVVGGLLYISSFGSDFLIRRRHVKD